MLFGGKLHGRIAPLAAGAEDVEDGVEDVPYVGLAGPSAGVDRRDVRLDQGPLCVGDVAGRVIDLEHVMVYGEERTDQPYPVKYHGDGLPAEGIDPHELPDWDTD